MSTVPKSKGKSDNNKLVFILLAAAAVIMLICTGIFGLMMVRTLFDNPGSVQRTSPGGFRPGDTAPTNPELTGTLSAQQVLKAFLTELALGQLDDAYQRTSTGFQSSMGPGEFRTLVERNRGIIGHVSARFLGTESGTGAQRFRIHLGGGPNGNADVTVEISREAGGYRVSSFTVP